MVASSSLMLAVQVALSSALVVVPAPRMRTSGCITMYATGDDTTISGYLTAMENKVAALASAMGRPVPERCVGDSCLPLSEYISVLEDTIAELESADMVAEAPPAPMPTMPEPDGTLANYLTNLESNVASLCAKFDVPLPQRCDEEQCLDLQSYIELLEQTVADLEQQGGVAASADEEGSLSLTAYLAKLEAKVADLTERLGAEAPARCVGDACLDLQSYIDLLEETAATLEGQWETQQGITW
eukprot:CAMPEP_0115854944 /NCGR_PEP_ID=MMETSP0287-20121206/14289_1 /TAXON_ID=412157 /ORGANISM="Chrysochromulina rotalis, Strain UIO044" /LENGTH=242 /DNA_ID=CAMNT_0003309085 /DNA_START=18 /DNA_END=746 /DNA_ORIENTATION=+